MAASPARRPGRLGRSGGGVVLLAVALVLLAAGLALILARRLADGTLALFGSGGFSLLAHAAFRARLSPRPTR